MDYLFSLDFKLCQTAGTYPKHLIVFNCYPNSNSACPVATYKNANKSSQNTYTYTGHSHPLPYANQLTHLIFW